jgi:aspartate aminotransferase
MATRRTPDVHLNLNVRGMNPSATVAINEHCNALRSKGLEIHKLGLGQSPFPVPAQVVQALRDHAHEKDYLPVKGLRQLRHEVAAYHGRRQNIEGDADDVLIGPGSKELMFLLQLVYYGDILIPTPAWVSYAPQADIIGRKVRWLHTEADAAWAFPASQLEEHCKADPNRPRVLILNYPNNPTGQTYSRSELEQLAIVARRYRVVVLSDEIYGELDHGGSHESIAALYPEGTIISGGLSKWCGAGGWRLGTFMFPKALAWLRDSMATVASETFTSTSAPIQFAAVTAFRGSAEIESYLVTCRRILDALGRWCAGRLRDAGARVPDPAGGFYLFPDLRPLREGLAKRGIVDSDQLCRRLLEETGVAILPGTSFGRPGDELNVRLAYVDFDGEAAIAAADAVPEAEALDDAYLEASCRSVVVAIERFAEWLEQS